MSGGPFAQATGLDNLPLDNFGGTADAGGAATDNSANVNVNGANDVAANASAEAQEIGAVPDPQSPAGQAAILAIIEKYHSKSTGTVEGAAATEQANGSQAADDGNSGSGSGKHHHKDGDDDSGSDSGSSGSLKDVLGQLLGAGGGGGLGGGSPFGQGMGGGSPFGQGMGGGMNPFGDAYGQQGAGGAGAASNPFSDPLATPAGAAPATAAAYNPSSDPFASSPSTGTGAAPTTAASSTTTGVTGADPFSTADNKNNTGSDKHADAKGDGEEDPNAGASESPTSGVDAGAFSSADGAAVPADPASTSTSGSGSK
jgi:hypothetical protein